MKRRDFTLATTAALASGSALAQQRAPVSGEDYLTLPNRANVVTPAPRIEVVEFFWYSCPHCNAFEPKLEAWIKRQAADVAVRRVPVAFRDDFVPEQRLFYALEAMGRLGDLHAKVFQSIHAERQPVNTAERVAAWATRNGLDSAKLMELYNSFSVSSKARAATQLQDQYKVQGVPAMGVAGRFYVDGELARNMDRALVVVDHLIDQVRKGR